MPSPCFADRSSKMNKCVSIRITGAGAVFAAACILLLPLRWILSAVIAAAVHELCHIAALKICRINISSLEVGAFGAKIETGLMMPAQQIICAAAGPLGSFLLLIFARWIPLISLLGFMQGVFNLLPIYPMDGGRILHSIFAICMPNCDPRFTDYIVKAFGFISVLLLIGLLLFYRRIHVALYLLFFLILTIPGRNNSCKDGTLGLQ